MITLFMILIIAFELFPLLVSAILLPSLYMVSGIVPASAAFGSWSNTTVWMVLGGLIFSTVLDECRPVKTHRLFCDQKMRRNLRRCGIRLFHDRYCTEPGDLLLWLGDCRRADIRRVQSDGIKTVA